MDLQNLVIEESHGGVPAAVGIIHRGLATEARRRKATVEVKAAVKPSNVV
jgi:hypothetical protein